jgi:acyl carrier protein
MTDLVQEFRNAMEEVVGDIEVEPTRETPIADLGIDSLSLIEVIMVLEETLGVDTQQDDFKDVVTVGDALDVFEALSAKAAV